MANIAKKIKSARLEMGWSIPDLAVRVRLPNSEIWSYEHGWTKPEYGVLLDMAEVFGVHADYFLCRGSVFNWDISLPVDCSLKSRAKRFLLGNIEFVKNRLGISRHKSTLEALCEL